MRSSANNLLSLMFNRLCYTLIFIFFLFLQANGNSTMPETENSLFAGGKWVKIETSATGIHKINFSWLKSIGFLHPESVRLFGSRNDALSGSNAGSEQNGPMQLPVMRFREVDGTESLLFFVKGPVSWKSDTVSGQYMHKLNQSARGKSWFFLTEDAGLDLKLAILGQPEGNPDLKVTGYDEVGVWEEEKINLLESGNRWFSSLLQGGNVLKKSFIFPDRIENEQITVNVTAVARSTSLTVMEVSVNGSVLGNLSMAPVQMGYDNDFASAGTFKTTRVLPGTDISLTLKYNGVPSDQCWFDYATVQLRRSLQYRGIPLNFRDSRSVGKGKIVEFQIGSATSGLQLWEVTNSLSPAQIPFQLSNGQISFRAKSDSLRNYILFDPAGQYAGLTKTEDVQNSGLQIQEVPQFLIVAPLRFLTQANQLAEYHRNKDGMAVTVVTVESVFNELSGGYPDVAALRNFVRNLYFRKFGSDGSALKYLLLFGKGTCDPVHDPNENNPDWIPSFQSENSLSAINSYVTDDFFGLLDPDDGVQGGNVDIGIGRIPAVSAEEATIAVDKIIHYHEAQTLGEWRNKVSFIGDDEDNNIHVNDSETLASLMNKRNPEYLASKIYLDAYPQVLTPEERYPDVNDAIRRSVQTGDLIVNYIGHASEDGLAHEKILTIQDIDKWTNKDRLPLFVTATCEFSRWDMIMKRSAGEHLLFHPAGGAIALLSATRLVYSASNFNINKSFFNHVFEKDSKGAAMRLGDLIRQVKNENSGSVNTLKFCLLGDPALRLNYPEYVCRNLEINNQQVSQFGGTVSPLSLVTISGVIEDSKGKKMEQFSGILSVKVFDQPTSKTTLGNGGLPPFSYAVQDNLLFNGEVKVMNGIFTYSFVVPKDVSFNANPGLVRYYFSNGTFDGNGSFADIHFNGKGEQPVADNNGPDIHLYLENEKFQDGSTVSTNPLLMVYLSDESGINTSTGGIGHDIVLELDGQTANPVILNDFYRTDQGSWKSGTIYYPLSTLASGKHSLKLKAWDNANNSSAVTVRFVVGNTLIINNLFNYPNPFSALTRFVITHNRYDELFDGNLEIMDLTGRIIFSGHKLVASQGYEIRDLYWDPRILNPVPVFGVYLYRITLTDTKGNRAHKSGRLIWQK